MKVNSRLHSKPRIWQTGKQIGTRSSVKNEAKFVTLLCPLLQKNPFTGELRDSLLNEMH